MKVLFAEKYLLNSIEEEGIYGDHPSGCLFELVDFGQIPFDNVIETVLEKSMGWDHYLILEEEDFNYLQINLER